MHDLLTLESHLHGASRPSQSAGASLNINLPSGVKTRDIPFHYTLLLVAGLARPWDYGIYGLAGLR